MAHLGRGQRHHTPDACCLVRDRAARERNHRDTTGRARSPGRNTQRMAIQNDELRAFADATRLDANEANEVLIGRIGQDLHDGPIQLVSLLMLRLTELAPKNIGRETQQGRRCGSSSCSRYHSRAENPFYRTGSARDWKSRLTRNNRVGHQSTRKSHWHDGRSEDRNATATSIGRSQNLRVSHHSGIPDELISSRRRHWTTRCGRPGGRHRSRSSSATRARALQPLCENTKVSALEASITGLWHLAAMSSLNRPSKPAQR